MKFISEVKHCFLINGTVNLSKIKMGFDANTNVRIPDRLFF